MIKVLVPKKHRPIFTQGDCWMLAEEISKITGWPRCAFDQGYGSDTHAFVRTPAGTLLDIDGETDEGEFRIRWDCYDESWSIIEVDANYEDEGWSVIFGRRKLAAEYAEALVEAYHHNHVGE